MMKSKSVSTRLYVLVTVLIVMMIIMGVVGLKSLSSMTDSLKTVYEDRVVALGQLGRVQHNLLNSYSDLMRGFQHDPRSEISKSHDHPVTEHVKRVEKYMAEMDSDWAAYSATHLTPEEKILAGEYLKLHDDYVKEVLLPTIEALRQGDYSDATMLKFLKGNRKLGKPAEDAMTKLQELQVTVAKDEFDKGMAEYHLERLLAIISIAVSLIMGYGLAFWVIRSITRPLEEVRGAIADVERNSDFTRRANVDSEDEVGQMARSFNQMVATLQTLARDFLGSTAKVSDGAIGLASTVQQVSTGSSLQSEAASSMAASVEEMTVSINHVADSAREALTISKHTGELSSKGDAIIQSAVTEISNISNTVRQAAETIENLGQQSDQISAVVQVIKDVADQTNLLALNAAIEAARAGEQGRGFAVVADEVRKLAERTTKATQEITSMINGIQDSARSAVGTMEHAVDRVGTGVTLAQEAGRAITEIKGGANQVVQVVNDISAALAEQSQASNDIAVHVEQVAQMSEENSAAAASAAESAGNMEELANMMRGAVSKFKV